MIHSVTLKADLLTTPSRGSEPAEAVAHGLRAARKHPDSEEIPSAPVDRATIDRAVAKVSEVLHSVDPGLKINVDDETQRVVVKVIDKDSGKVIRQIPPEELLDLEKYLSGSKGVLLEKQA